MRFSSSIRRALATGHSGWKSQGKGSSTVIGRRGLGVSGQGVNLLRANFVGGIQATGPGKRNNVICEWHTQIWDTLTRHLILLG